MLQKYSRKKIYKDDEVTNYYVNDDAILKIKYAKNA